MSVGERVGECFRSTIVRILLLILLLVLIGVGVFLLLKSSAENDEDSLDFGPQIDGKHFIRYDSNDRNSVMRVVRGINDYLQPYNSSSPNNHKGCSLNLPAPAGKTCEVSLTDFDPCIKSQSYGYFKTQPCVFLKLNKDAEWTPKFFNETELPASMPEDLKNTIKDYVRRDRKLSQFVWISCDGKSEQDKKNMGSVRYLPRQGFPGYFYPCTSQEECNKPLVAVQFLKPTVNEKIYVQCQIWAENLYDTVDFEIMVENLAPRSS